MTATSEIIFAPRMDQPADGRCPVSPPGVIGAAIIKAARRSARLTRRRLARAAAVSPATVHKWENGSLPLYRVSYRELRHLAGALGSEGAIVGADIADLMIAAQCDLLITGMLDAFEDYAEVPPIEEPGQPGELARELIRWALAGIVPDRFRGLSAWGSLLAPADAVILASLARDLCAGTGGPELVAFGTVLVALTER